MNDEKKLLELNGLRFKIDYGDFVFENRYISNNIMVWKSINGKSMTGLDEDVETTEEVTVLVPEPNKFLVSWVEKTQLGVTQYLNFEDNTIYSIIRKDNELTTEKGKLYLL